MRTANPKENRVHRNSRSVFHCGCFCYIIYRRRGNRLSAVLLYALLMKNAQYYKSAQFAEEDIIRPRNP